MLALAQKLHDDYVRSGQEEGDRLVSEAKSQATRIVREAEETSQPHARPARAGAVAPRAQDRRAAGLRARLPHAPEELPREPARRPRQPGQRVAAALGPAAAGRRGPEPLTHRPATTRRIRTPASPQVRSPSMSRHAGFHPAWCVVRQPAARILSRDFEDKGEPARGHQRRAQRGRRQHGHQGPGQARQARSRCATARSRGPREEVKDVADELIDEIDRLTSELRSGRRRAVRPAAQLRRRRRRRPGRLRLVARSSASRSSRSSTTRATCSSRPTTPLARIAAGTFGTCESCGEAIGKARLQAFPRATLCVECKQREERR